MEQYSDRTLEGSAASLNRLLLPVAVIRAVPVFALSPGQLYSKLTLAGRPTDAMVQHLPDFRLLSFRNQSRGAPEQVLSAVCCCHFWEIRFPGSN